MFRTIISGKLSVTKLGNQTCCEDKNIELETVKSDTNEPTTAAEISEDHLKRIVKNVTTLDEAFEEVKNSNLKGHLTLFFIIDESFEQFDKNNSEKLSEILQNQQVIVFQSQSDGTFCIAWKMSKEEVYTVNFFQDNISKENLSKLCNFIMEFLSDCLSRNHIGISNEISSAVDKLNVDLPSLADTNNFNLLFYAASKGNVEIIPVLLEVAFNVNMMCDVQLAVNYAYAYQHYEAVLVLLKNNSYFPIGFDLSECPNEEIKAFVDKGQSMHDHIKANNLEEIRIILSENPSLRHFYNALNLSASAAAIENKNFEAYELLLQNNMFLSPWEEIDELIESFSCEEKKEIREIHFRNKKDIQEQYLKVLLSKCSVGHDDEKVQERLNHVMRALQELNNFTPIRILLKIAALFSNLQIIFDFNRDLVNYLDPTLERPHAGLFYLNGRIYIGAKQLLDSSTEHLVFATIAHELCHFVMYKIFGNDAKPYKANDALTEIDFEVISSECILKKDIDQIVSMVYDLYPKDMHHAELIVRIPHFYAHYCKQPEMIDKLKKDFMSLFDFYETKLFQQLEEAMIDLEKKAEKKRRAKDKKISMLIFAVIAVCIILSGVAILVGIWFYEPNYNWSTLNIEEKEKVLNGHLRFEGVKLKFHELYGRNETHNGVFDKLTSAQIKSMLKHEILDLNESQNEFLEKDIFLIYQNLTENLKKKIKKSSIDFQDQQTIISTLLKNDTKSFLQTLNSLQIIELIKDRSSIKVGQKVVNAIDFYIERTFVDKSTGGYERKSRNYDLEKMITFFIFNVTKDESISSSDLFIMFLSEKLILLSDDAGNGKTTSYKNIAQKLQHEFPHKWVQFVDLKTKVKVYEEYQNLNFDVLSILSEIFDLKDLSLEIFKILYNNQNVIILWDGFDEISPTYTNFILRLIETIKSHTQNIQFISTRPHYEKIIRQTFNSTAFILFPFTTDDNDEYLDKFYDFRNFTAIETQKARRSAQELIEKIEAENWETIDYVESPLLLHMIAEISLNFNDSLFDATNLYTTYESFMMMKINLTNDMGPLIQNEKNELIWTGFHLKESIQFLALKEAKFYELKISEKYDIADFDTNKLSRYGILVFNSNGNAEFVHRTFLEFFVAQYLIENLYNTKGESDCNELEKRFRFFLNEIHDTFYPKVKEFLLEFLATKRSRGVNQKFMECFKKSGTYLNRIFYENVNFFQVIDVRILKKLLEIFPFSSELLEILWDLNSNVTFFNWWAINFSIDFLYDYDEIEQILIKYFPNDVEKQEKLLFGENQRANFLYGVYKRMEFERERDKKGYASVNRYEKLDISHFLWLLDVSVDFNPNLLRNISSLFEFDDFIRPFLSHEEILQSYRTNFVDILAIDGVRMWKQLKAKFTHKEIQEMILKRTVTGEPILSFIRDFDVIKLILDTLKDIPNSLFVTFALDNLSLLFEKKLLTSYNNFEPVWSEIANRTSNEDKREILRKRLRSKDYSMISIYERSIFSASIEVGSKEHFERIIIIYKQYFSFMEMKQLSMEYFAMNRKRTNPWHPNFATVQSFVSYLKELFTVDEIKNHFKNPIIKLYEMFSYRERLNESYPLFSLLKEITPKEEFDNITRQIHETETSINGNWPVSRPTYVGG